MTEREFWVFMNNSYSKGRAQQVSGQIDSDDGLSSKASGFISAHSLLPSNYGKISIDIIKDMGKLLMDKRVKLKTKEAILIILAHHGSNESLRVLKFYNKYPDQNLEIYAELALQECEMWNEDWYR